MKLQNFEMPFLRNGLLENLVILLLFGVGIIAFFAIICFLFLCIFAILGIINRFSLSVKSGRGVILKIRHKQSSIVQEVQNKKIRGLNQPAMTKLLIAIDGRYRRGEMVVNQINKSSITPGSCVDVEYTIGRIFRDITLHKIEIPNK